jgi:RNA polymerase sigma-70 factor (ECF subfamily)
VLRTIYLLFNEGYSASDGDRLVREDICDEALRLAEVMAWHARASSPEAHALAALILFQHARRRARVSSDGRPMMLEEQDRRLWDSAMIARGFQHLAAAKNETTLSSYHLEAGIASVHAMAPSWQATDWASVLDYYDGLIDMGPSPVVAINRAIAVSMVEGPEAALAALSGLSAHKAIERYLPYHMTIGELELRSGRRQAARDAFTRALALPMSAQERRFVETKLSSAADA